MFIVSPEPDVSAYTLDVQQTGCIVLASDGLWNMVRPQEAVDLVDYVTENVIFYLFASSCTAGVRAFVCV